MTISGRTGVFLRDYADEANPQNFCSFGEGVVVTEILDPHHVVISSPVAAVVELPSTQVFELGIAGRLVAVAPDLSQVLWVSRPRSPPTLHDSWDAGNVPIQTYPAARTTCADVDTVSRAGAFSRDGHFGYALWNQGPTGGDLSERGRQPGRGVRADSAGGGLGEGWVVRAWRFGRRSSSQLFYEQQGNVWRWTRGRRRRALQDRRELDRPGDIARRQRIAYGGARVERSVDRPHHRREQPAPTWAPSAPMAEAAPSS